MKLHYFDQPSADADDRWLTMAVNQGYVPKTCLLGGQLVMSEMNAGRDPCAGCECDRLKCNGRPKQPTQWHQPGQSLEDRAIQYIKNGGSEPTTIKKFDDDHAPIGPTLRDSLKTVGLVWERDGCVYLSGELPKSRLDRPPASAPPAPVPKINNDAFYFMGVDPAPAQGKRADDGALVTLKARPRDPKNMTANPGDWITEYVWAYRLRGASMRQWSGFVHQKHQHFGFSGILLDPGAGGGGGFLMLELSKTSQLINGIETTCRPICCPEDHSAPSGEFILNMFRRSDPGIAALWPTNLRNDSNLPDNMHVQFQEAVEHALFALPRPIGETPKEESALWTPEQRYSAINLEVMAQQLISIQAATKDDGGWITNTYGARLFSASGKKDLAYAGIFAWLRFLIWLRQGADSFGMHGDDAAMVFTM